MTRNGWITVAVLLLIVNTALLGGALALRRGSSNAAPPGRSDRFADLLGWLPANATTTEAFAVWSNGDALPPGDLLDRLGVGPQPMTLGQGGSWRSTFGWDEGDVTAWATAGTIAVLDGSFDVGRIEEALKARGYQRSSHLGVDVWIGQQTGAAIVSIGGESPVAALVIGVTGSRLITASRQEDVLDAIDAAGGDGPALADAPGVAALLKALEPADGLMATSQQRLAIDCGGDPTATGGAGLVGVGYRPAGSEHLLRTEVAVTFPSDAAAAAGLPPLDAGWRDGFTNAGGAGGSIADYGTVTETTQRGSAVVTELVDGTEDGWVRAGVRFATPVCEAALAATSLASPVSKAGTDTAASAALAALPDLGPDATYRMLDIERTAGARAVSLPSGASLDATKAWLDALRPRPAIQVFDGSAAVAGWHARFGIDPANLRSVAELTIVASGDTSAVLIGPWDEDTVRSALSGAGYASVTLDGVSEWAAPDGADAGVWTNVALSGDRLWIGSSQSLMRKVVDIATGQAPSPDGSGGRDQLLSVDPGATAAAVASLSAVRSTCDAQMPGWETVALTWTAASGGDRATVVVGGDGSEPVSSLAGDLDQRLRRLSVAAPSESSASPGTSPVSTIPLTSLVTIDGIESAASEPVVMARLSVVGESDSRLVDVYSSLVDSCALMEIR